MSQHSVELVAKFKDNATPGLRRLAARGARPRGAAYLHATASKKGDNQTGYDGGDDANTRPNGVLGISSW